MGSQVDRIIAYMEDKGSITTMEAFTELGITRLASRIHDIRKMGKGIDTESIKVKTRTGEDTYVTRYSLEKESK